MPMKPPSPTLQWGRGMVTGPPLLFLKPLCYLIVLRYLLGRLRQMGFQLLVVVARLLPLIEQVVVPVSQLILLRLEGGEALLQLGSLKEMTQTIS